ncbi:MAG: S24 family peptidase [Gammaproteobacteria bacterium]|nr:S24 family peptidase [Gammaproteobacteria bacterium]
MSNIIQSLPAILCSLLQANRINESELSRRTNIPRATINRIASGKSPSPRTDTLKLIAQYFDVTVDQLIGTTPINKESDATTQVNYLPIFEMEKCGEILNSAYDSIDNGKILGAWTDADSKFATKLSGDSMWPQFQEGTTLILDSRNSQKNRDYVLAYLSEQKQVIFRQLLLDGKFQYLKALNPIFPTVELKQNDKILGVLVETRCSFTSGQ